MPQPTALVESTTLVDSNCEQANLVEIFSAIQGEGINVGTRQLFVRFGGCDLRCTYCDSAHTWRPNSSCEIETSPASRQYEECENPVSQTQLLSWITRLDQPKVHDSISLTGGEPLLHGKFLEEFLPVLTQKSNLPIYLETGGHHPSALRPLLPWIDLIGMDIKLPSVSGEEHWESHKAFLRLAVQSQTAIFCKMIVSNQTKEEDLETAAHLIREADPAIACFLQPMTPLNPALLNNPRHQHLANAPTPGQVLAWQTHMKQYLDDVRVIPQTHKMIDQK